MKHIVLILFIITLFSCDKGKADVTIRGVVFDSSLSVPLSNAIIKIYQVQSGSPNELIAQTNTNSNGEYSLTFKRNPTEFYNIISEKNNYFDLDETISFSDISIEDENVYNFSTTAISWVKLNFINSSGQSSDVLRYIKQEGKSGCNNCCPNGEQFLYGIVDTSLVYFNDGNFNFSYQYYVIGTADQGLKSTQTVAFDTTDINLFY